MSSRTRVALLASVLTATAALLSACSFTTADAMCNTGEHPVIAVNSTTGGACVTDGDRTPSGYARYPQGKEPQHVGDKWDTYWESHMVNEQGKVVAAP